MKKYAMDKAWEYVESGMQNPLMVNMLQGWKKTNLPHDYSIEKPRDPKSPTECHEGFMQGAGLYYKKEFEVAKAAEGKRFYLEFEGAAGITMVWVNSKFAGKHMNPYTSFVLDVTEHVNIGDNMLMVHTDSRMKPNSRWYVGTGIYRHVWMYVSEQIAVKPNTLQVTTQSLSGNEAILDISAKLIGEAESVFFCLKDKTGNVIAEEAGELHGGGASGRINAHEITPWSLDVPELYTVEAIVKSSTAEDVSAVRIGIRTVEVNAKEGFKLNGEPLKLKGGCIHHDLGILGAATHDAAEYRRVKILKDNGFMALRLAHNPFGPSIFNACDELGMLVIEEAFDEWVLGRTSFGLHITFEKDWEDDLTAMIARDYNHPSIIMWSTGNEVEERDGSADGFAWSRCLAEKVKSLDMSRPVSATACALFREYGNRPADGTTGNQALNMAFDNFASGVDLWGEGTEKYFEPLDVSGYNYKCVRYGHDRKKYPDRVIYGSESYPRAALDSWKSVENNTNVIGDFVWTAWEYIGEAGTGRWEIGNNMRPGDVQWPWLLAYCGDFDILGRKRPQSFYRDVVWQLADAPKLFCLPPELVDKNIVRMSWTWDPVQRNYTFPGLEGEDIEVTIYADADEVELIQNGSSIGRKPCTVMQEYIARFQIPYVPGKLEAVSYKGGQVSGKDCLVTAKEAGRLVLTAEKTSIKGDGADLCFVMIQAQDEHGVHVYGEKHDITVKLLGGGELIALGNADPKPERLVPYGSDTCPMFHGELMAVIRSDDSDGCIIEVTMSDGIKETLQIDFTSVKESGNRMISPLAFGPLDMALGDLFENEKAVGVLNEFMGDLLKNPMLEAMKGMSLKKLLSMGGQSVPKELKSALVDVLK